MKKFFLLTTAASAMCLSGAAFAQGYYSGTVALEYFDDGTSGSTIATIDMTAVYATDMGDMNIGFEFDVLGITDNDGTLSESAILPEVYLEGSFGKVAAGHTEGAVKQLLPDVTMFGSAAYNSTDLYGSYFYAVFPGFGGTELVPYSYIDNTLFFPDFLTARYDGNFGDTQVSASYTENTAGFGLVELSGRFDLGQFAVSGGYEMLTATNTGNFALGVEADAGPVQFASLATIFDGGDNSVIANADYDMGGGLFVGARAAYSWNATTSLTSYGVGAGYEVIPNLTLTADYDGFDGNDMWNLGTAYSF